MECGVKEDAKVKIGYFGMETGIRGNVGLFRQTSDEINSTLQTPHFYHTTENEKNQLFYFVFYDFFEIFEICLQFPEICSIIFLKSIESKTKILLREEKTP